MAKVACCLPMLHVRFVVVIVIVAARQLVMLPTHNVEVISVTYAFFACMHYYYTFCCCCCHCFMVAIQSSICRLVHYRTHTHTSTGTVAKRPHNGQVNWQVNRQTHTGKHTHTVTYTCTYPLVSMYMCVFLCLCNVIAFNLARAVACTAFYVLHASFHPSPAHPAQPQPRTFHTTLGKCLTIYCSCCLHICSHIWLRYVVKSCLPWNTTKHILRKWLNPLHDTHPQPRSTKIYSQR